MTRSDIAVIGAGPIGAAMAIGLAREGFKVTLVEQQASPTQKIGETLPPEIQEPLETLKLWDLFLACHPKPFKGLRTLWGRKMARASQVMNYQTGTNGWYIHRQRFETALIQEAVQVGCQVLSNQHFVDLHVEENGWIIDLAEHPPLNASFIIDCTGRNRAVGRKLKAEVIQYEQLLGLAGFFQTTLDTSHELLIEATPNGWWYSALLGEQQIVGVFVSHYRFFKDNFPQDKRGNDIYAEIWQQELLATQETRLRFNDLQPLAPFQVAPAGASQLTPCGGKNWLAVGDAAFTVDPVCAYGLYAGFIGCTLALQAVKHVFQGDNTTLNLYIQQQEAIIQQHVLDCQLFYSKERRWLNSEFWRGRYRKQSSPSN